MWIQAAMIGHLCARLHRKQAFNTQLLGDMNAAVSSRDQGDWTFLYSKGLLTVVHAFLTSQPFNTASSSCCGDPQP